jgi:hypothetical protein
MYVVMQGRSVAFVARGYERDRGRRNAAFSAAGRLKASAQAGRVKTHRPLFMSDAST